MAIDVARTVSAIRSLLAIRDRDAAVLPTHYAKDVAELDAYVMAQFESHRIAACLAFTQLGKTAPPAPTSVQGLRAFVDGLEEAHLTREPAGGAA